MIKPKLGWFLAFTAVFAVLAGFVFWGTWSLDMVPVMPDCATQFPTDNLENWIRGWRAEGRFVPGDLVEFIGSPYFWVELKYVLATYCAALGMAYFLRGRGLSPLASYGAGLFLAFCGYWFTLFSAGHLGWFQWMTYGVFAFGLIDRAIAKGKWRHWILLGACLAWGSFYQPDLWLVFTVFTAFYFFFRWVSWGLSPSERGLSPSGEGRRSVWKVLFAPRLLKGMGVALAVFILIGLPSFRHAIVSDLAGRDQQISEGQTLSGSNDTSDDARWEFVTNWSLPPKETVEFFNARVNGDTSCQQTLAIGLANGNGIRPYTGALGRPLREDYGNYRQHSLYVGWVTCLLAAFAVLAAFARLVARRRLDGIVPRDGTVFFLAVAAVVFCCSAFGRYCEPVYRIIYRLPMGDYLRAPVKWHHLTEFCLVALAGFGLETIRRLCLRLRMKPLAVNVVLGCVVVFGAVDLARVARLYCAPHAVGRVIVPVPENVDITKLPPDVRFVHDVPSAALSREPVGPDREAQMIEAGEVVLGHHHEPSLSFPIAYAGTPESMLGPHVREMRARFEREGQTVTDVSMREENGWIVVTFTGDFTFLFREAKRAMAEVKVPRPSLRPKGDELTGCGFWMAALSVFMTFFVLTFLATDLCRGRFSERRIA